MFKPLKEHRLLQAIARTNRPYKDVKEAGLIIDYIGILNDLQKAFQLYVDDRFFTKREIDIILADLDQIKIEFSEILQRMLSTFKGIPLNNYQRGTLLDAVRILSSDENLLKAFLDDFKAIRKKFELLSSEQIKAETLSHYKWLIAIHTYYTIQVEGRKTEEERKIEKYEERYLTKTIKIAHRTTEIERIKKDLPRIEFDENYLTNLNDKLKDKKDKAANIVFALNKFVLVDKDSRPVYEGLVEKVQRLMDKWKQKNENFEEMYQEGASIINEMNRNYKRQKDLGMSDSEYAVLLTLEKIWNDDGLVDDSKRLINKLKENGLLFHGSFEQKSSSKEIDRDPAFHKEKLCITI